MSGYRPRRPIRRTAPEVVPGTIERRPSARERLLEHWLEILATFVLALGSVLAAWSANQATLWNGEQAAGYTRAATARAEAGRAANRAGQLVLLDLTTFSSYAEAFNSGDSRLAAFYERRFRAEFRPAFAAWIALRPLENPDAPSSPVLLPEYRVAEEERAQQLNAEAEAHFIEAERAGAIGGLYSTNGFIIALALFFAGIAPRFGWRPLKIVVVVLALLVLLWAAGNLAVYPRQPAFMFGVP